MRIERAEVLMAMTVWEDPHFYVGWFGQNYMGSLEFYLLAMTAPWGNWSPLAIRLVLLSVVAGQLVLVAWIAMRSGGESTARISIVLMCLLSPFAYDWELRARNYQLMMFIVLLSLALELKLVDGPVDASTLLRHEVLELVEPVEDEVNFERCSFNGSNHDEMATVGSEVIASRVHLPF